MINEENEFSNLCIGFMAPCSYLDDIYYTKHLVYPPRNKNPSLAMRLRDLEFQTSKECVHMGRGYIKTESVKDRYVMTGGSFTCKSKDWDDEVLNIFKCSVCGSTTADKLKDSSQIYCSDDCAVESYARKNGRAEKSVFDLIRPGEVGTVEIRKEILDSRAPCSVILQSQRSLYEKLNTLSKTAEELFRAEKGDYVLVEDEMKAFLRGVVVDMDSTIYKVALIDKSEIVYVSDVYATTEPLEKEITFGGVVTFKGNENPLSNLIQFRARERGPFGIWICDVLESNESDDLTEIILEQWSPPLKIDTVSLESGCSVVITQYLDARTVYVKRIDSPWNEECIRYNNDIAAYCVEDSTCTGGRYTQKGVEWNGFWIKVVIPEIENYLGYNTAKYCQAQMKQGVKLKFTAPKYQRFPVKGEICCARYEKDGSFYRGVVRGIEKNLIVITFLDYGTEQLTKLSDLRYLPALAKQVTSFSRLVKLKDVKLDSTPEAIHYLNRMTAYGCELVVTWEGNCRDEVILIDKYSGEILNNVIYNYEIPTWVKSRHAFSKSGEIYDYTTIQEVSFTCGATEDVYVLNYDETSFRNQGIFWGTVGRSDYLGHMNGELKERMAEFCGHMVNDRYLPRIGELCIAMYKGEWSRALCLEDKDIICRLTFIDHGTSLWVETKNIRKILKEFLEMPALALKCAVAGIHDMGESEKEELVAYVKRKTQKVIPGVKILKRLGEIYYMEITVRTELEDDEDPPIEASIIDGVSKSVVAITITCSAGGITLNEVIFTIKTCIDFEILGIDEPRFRKLSANLLILQVEGENCREDAKVAVEELISIFSDKGVQINCLATGKLKLSGFTGCLSREEIIEEIAQIANIQTGAIHVHTFGQSGRITIAWVKLPLAAAIDIAVKGTIQLGSSLAKAELHHRRPVRCFRCLREGHIGAHCFSNTVESKCFRCSQAGHKAADCDMRPFCDLCSERGYPSAHRIGSSSCRSREDFINGLEDEYN